MIVKDQEATIHDCLKRAQEFTNEIILVDTGSSDRTIEISKQFHTVHIIQHTWRDHFAEARNRSLEFAKGDWIMWLDADELIDDKPRNRLLLKEIIQQTTANIIYFPVVNYVGKSMDKEYKNNSFHSYQPRLFRNHLGIQFINRIHEFPKLPESHEIEAHYIDILIHHYGYLDEADQQYQKFNRNIELLSLELKNAQSNPWIYYHLASEFYRIKEYLQAFGLINTAIVVFLNLEQKPPALLYRLKYAILVETNSYDGAWPSIQKAIDLYPDYVDLHYYKALILKQRKQYAEAIIALDTCLSLGDKSRNYFILKGTGTFRAQQLKEECFQLLESIS
ncbi:glycosyltransferase [Bacillaceae bacterium SIJ1]|nr:glycosyltransferase [Litoribacterium kuwaitense]